MKRTWKIKENIRKNKTRKINISRRNKFENKKGKFNNIKEK